MEGIIKRWHPDRNWGLIYAPGDQRFFLHTSKIIRGRPELFRRVEFEIAPARNPSELPQAVNVIVTEEATHSLRGQGGRP
jgi:cold shock CspA family protein